MFGILCGWGFFAGVFYPSSMYLKSWHFLTLSLSPAPISTISLYVFLSLLARSISSSEKSVILLLSSFLGVIFIRKDLILFLLPQYNSFHQLLNGYRAQPTPSFLFSECKNAFTPFNPTFPTFSHFSCNAWSHNLPKNFNLLTSIK